MLPEAKLYYGCTPGHYYNMKGTKMGQSSAVGHHQKTKRVNTIFVASSPRWLAGSGWTGVKISGWKTSPRCRGEDQISDREDNWADLSEIIELAHHNWRRPTTWHPTQRNLTRLFNMAEVIKIIVNDRKTKRMIFFSIDQGMRAKIIFLGTFL